MAPASVSVIIAVFNRAATLQRCLDSVFAQSAAPLEAIVNNETSPSPVLAANNNLLDGWITIDCTAEPAVIGLPASCVSMPELGSSR